jgi:alkylation response protein AidB-like acyl-CoA dehydrogenase
MFAQLSAGPGDAGVAALAAKIFTIFEETSEIQRMIIGRAVTGLDVR